MYNKVTDQELTTLLGLLEKIPVGKVPTNFALYKHLVKIACFYMNVQAVSGIFPVDSSKLCNAKYRIAIFLKNKKDWFKEEHMYGSICEAYTYHINGDPKIKTLEEQEEELKMQIRRGDTLLEKIWEKNSQGGMGIVRAQEELLRRLLSIRAQIQRRNGGEIKPSLKTITDLTRPVR